MFSYLVIRPLHGTACFVVPADIFAYTAGNAQNNDPFHFHLSVPVSHDSAQAWTIAGINMSLLLLLLLQGYRYIERAQVPTQLLIGGGGHV